MKFNLSFRPLFIRLFINFPNAKIIRKMSSDFRIVYVRHLETEDSMKINFSFGTPEFTDRNFTFIRQKDEKLESTLSRMQLKITDAMTKKLAKKKKRTSDVNSPISTLQSPILSLNKGNNIIDCSLKCFDAWTSCTEFKINDIVYQVVLNPPSVLHLNLPKSIMAGFPVYPKIKLEFCSKEHCLFTWYRSIHKSNLITCYRDDIVKFKGESWLPLSNDFFYVTQEDDIGCRLKLSCVPKLEDKTGLEEYAISSGVVQPGPKKCPFEDRHEFTRERTKPGSLRCVSYNILADLYADTDTARNDLFPYCPTEALTVDYRKQLYLKEIVGYNGDIICLQEVDRKIFNDDLIPVLSSTGLEGIYSEKGGQVVEGLACFYRTSKFKLVETHSLILSEALKVEPVLQQIYSKIQESENLKEKIMNRTTALQVALLESIEEPKRRILVGNTHLYFHPKSDNIRLLQGASCLLYLESLLIKHRQMNDSCTTGLIFCGDFNSSPDCGVYNLMTTGQVGEACIDWQSNPTEEVPGLPFRHSLAIGSACGAPEYTNYTEGFAGCLDYIFYDKTAFNVGDVVPFPKHDQVIENRAIPSVVFPSDHIALICTLDWK